MNLPWSRLKYPMKHRTRFNVNFPLFYLQDKAWRFIQWLEWMRNPEMRTVHYYYYGIRSHQGKQHPVCLTRLRLFGPDFCNDLEPWLFISDPHFRGHPLEQFLLALFERFHWSTLLLGGDYLPEPGVDPEGFWTQDFLKRMRHRFPQKSILAVLGNHDNHAVKNIFKSWQVRVLEDERMVFSLPNGAFIGVLGCKDPHRSRPDKRKIEEFLSMHPSVRTWIVVAHSPDILLYLPEDPRIRLILTGHTHGGQISLGHHQPLWFNTRVRRTYASGLRSVYNGWIYTSRGLGYTFAPIRVMCPPEVVEIQFKYNPRVMVTLEEIHWLVSESRIDVLNHPPIFTRTGDIMRFPMAEKDI